jgi:hypothetical protein
MWTQVGNERALPRVPIAAAIPAVTAAPLPAATVDGFFGEPVHVPSCRRASAEAEGTGR